MKNIIDQHLIQRELDAGRPIGVVCMEVTHTDILKAANTVLGLERGGKKKGELYVFTAGEGRLAKKYRSDSRIMTSPPKYFTELNMQLYIHDDHDLHEIEKLKVGEYYLNEFARYTRVA